MATTYDLVILNGVVVTDTDVGEYDIAVKNEKIAKVAARGSFKDVKSAHTIDAEGGYVMVRHTLKMAEVIPSFHKSRFCEQNVDLNSQEAWTAMSIFKNLHCSERARQQTTMRPVLGLVRRRRIAF